MRLIFATMVVTFHMFFLADVPSWRIAEPVLREAAALGVQGFFVLSGYLVYDSLIRSRSLIEYAYKRFRRIYPAYAAVIICCAIGALAVSPEARGDLASVGRYVGWNLAFANFLAPELPGIFQNNLETQVNGALWTLKIEVMFYLVLPALAWILRISGRSRLLVVIAIYVGAEIWRQTLVHVATAQLPHNRMLIELSHQLPGQMSFFIVGIALAEWRVRFTWRSPLPVVGATLLVLSVQFAWLESFRALGVGIVAVWLAIGLPRLSDAARFGDISYGIYITHFPIIQAVVAIGLFSTSLWIGVGVAAAAILVAGFLLWHLVEKPSLRRDSAYLRPRS